MITIKTFGDKLKALRLAAGLTQEELADKCGMKKQSISRYENSDREPNIRIAKSLADALGVSLEALVNSDTFPGSRDSFLQFFAEKQAPLSDRQRRFIEILDQYPPETQDALIDKLEGIMLLLQSQDRKL